MTLERIQNASSSNYTYLAGYYSCLWGSMFCLFSRASAIIILNTLFLSFTHNQAA